MTNFFILKRAQWRITAGSYGFTLIELLIVVAIIGILAAIAIPGYLGLQERGRRGSVIRAAAAAEADISGWLTASLKSGPGAALTEVDTDCSGTIVIGADSSNSAIGGLVATGYATAKRSGTTTCTEVSPWSTGLSLWNSGAALNASAARQIIVAQSANMVSIVAADANGSVIHQKIIPAD